MNYLTDNIYIPVLNRGDKLYHYTSVSGFEGICKGEFWVTESSFLDDKTELSVATNVFCKLVDNHVKNRYVCDKLKQKVIEYLKNDLNYQSINVEAVNLDSFYILSFSLNHDDLSMWNQFTNNSGYCLSFDFQNLFDSFEKDSIFCSGKVIYDEVDQINILEKEICQLFFNGEFFRDWNDFDNMTEDKIYDIYQILSASLSIYNQFFKHSYFKNENEYRFVFYRHCHNENHYSYKQYFRIKNDLLIPYIKVKLLTLDSLDEVMVAPKNDKEISKLSVLRYLNTLNVKAKVTNSEVQIR
mgnify:CR=1 FL=1